MSMKKIVLFAGTTEGHRLCECFVQNKWQAEVFVATEYGREILPQAPNLHIHAGRLDMKQIYSQLTQIRPVCVLDATHPYADEVTKISKKPVRQQEFPICGYCGKYGYDGKCNRQCKGAYPRGRQYAGSGGFVK